jgi:hypothetical protein
VTRDTPSFFTLDRGTTTTAATLVAPVEGRYRMLAAGAVPAEVEPEVLLEDLAWRVARTDAAVAGSMEGWRDWPRLEVRTWRAPRACLVAASPETGMLLERAVAGAGWQVTARFYGPEPDLIEFGEACLEETVDAVIVGGRETADESERDHARLLWPRAGSLARLRDDLAVIACGPFIERPEGIPDDRLFALPAPDASQAALPLRQAALQVGGHLVNGGPVTGVDGHTALRTAIGSLAVLLERRVEGIEVGAAVGSRTLVGSDGELRHAITAEGGLLPRALLEDDDVAESILGWSSLPGDLASRFDRLRDLALRPWSQVDREGVHLRLAALRAALERMQARWEALAPDPRPDGATPDVVVLSGGGFALLPAAASALAVADAIRRTGASTILHDHARLLAPLGALPVEADRRRLLSDLMDDALLPIGSSLLTGAPGGNGKGPGTVTISSMLGEEEVSLEAGQLLLVDLPPGIVARLEIDPGSGSVLGVERQRLRLEASGGLGGLLIDTRDVPLDWPANGEQRRALLERWEEPVWMGSDR